MGTTAAQAGQVNAELAGELLGPGRCHHPAAGRGDRRRQYGGNCWSRYWSNCLGSYWNNSWGRHWDRRGCRSNSSSGHHRCLGSSGGNLGLGLHDQANGLAHRSRAAGRHQNGSQVTLVKRLHVHIGLVTLDNKHGLAPLHLVAGLLEPLHDLALRHGGGEGGHEDFVGCHKPVPACLLKRCSNPCANFSPTGEMGQSWGCGGTLKRRENPTKAISTSALPPKHRWEPPHTPGTITDLPIGSHQLLAPR